MALELSDLVDIDGVPSLFQYRPCSDFSIVIRGFPVLILEVTSDPHNSDMTRMLLQASCLVRLGNSLLKTKSQDFLIKAIYIDSDYVATDYTLFLNKSDPNDDDLRVKLPPVAAARQGADHCCRLSTPQRLTTCMNAVNLSYSYFVSTTSFIR